jgi:RHS repeat-associated protein
MQSCTNSDLSLMHFTSKERDSESGLDNFGKRYNAGTMGRFMSVDPTGLNAFTGDPQTWNRYSYAHNNPLDYVDSNGKWPTSIHNQIIDTAFPNLTASQRQILKDVSAHQDAILSGGLGDRLAFQHATRSPGESVSQAEANYSTFVSMNEDQATKDQVNFWLAGNSGYSDKALTQFAAALHAILDSTSPAHTGLAGLGLEESGTRL